MRKVLLLAILSECVGTAGTIEYASVSETVYGSFSSVWAQVVYQNEPVSSARVQPWKVGERWTFSDETQGTSGSGITLLNPILPDGAVVSGRIVVYDVSDTGSVSVSKTVSVWPVLEDCNGLPCPYSPADFRLGGYISGCVDWWSLTDYGVEAGVTFQGGIAWNPDVDLYALLSPGFNAITTIRWTLDATASVTVSLVVAYEIPDGGGEPVQPGSVPEPATAGLFVGGLVSMLAVRARGRGRRRAHFHGSNATCSSTRTTRTSPGRARPSPYACAWDARLLGT